LAAEWDECPIEVGEGSQKLSPGVAAYALSGKSPRGFDNRVDRRADRLGARACLMPEDPLMQVADEVRLGLERGRELRAFGAVERVDSARSGSSRTLRTALIGSTFASSLTPNTFA